jgi:predicted P-loop ATPase
MECVVERMQVKGFKWPVWSNVDDSTVAALLLRFRQTKTRFRPAKEFLWDTLFALAHENEQDPVIDALADLESKWDGTSRITGWLTRYCGVPDDVYHRAVGKLIIGGMVMRARKPGCKFDFMPIFFGPQGTGKSTMARILAQRLDWFTDTIMLGDQSKELVLSLAGKLVVEISEMGMRSSADLNQVKAMITRQVDAGRTAYARSVSERPRRNIFIGTTNESTPLSDPTGNRRFLPINVTREIDLPAFVQDVAQLVGEAAALESKGDTFDLPREVWAIAAQYQDNARTESDIETKLTDWFGGDVSAFITVSDLVTLQSAMGRKNAGAQVHPVLERLGFRQDSPRIDGKKARVWVRGPEMLPKHIPNLPRYVPDVSRAHDPRVVMRQTTVESARYAAALGLPPPLPQMR